MRLTVNPYEPVARQTHTSVSSAPRKALVTKTVVSNPIATVKAELVLKTPDVQIDSVIPPESPDEKEPSSGTPLEAVKSSPGVIPTWAYGAGAGGIAALAAVGIGVGHTVTKKRRQIRAHEIAVQQAADQFFNLTPRDILPTKAPPVEPAEK